MRNVKIVFASVVVTLVVVFGFVSIGSSYASVTRDVPLVLTLNIIVPPVGSEPLVVNFSSRDFVEGAEGIYVAQAQASDVDEVVEGGGANETETEVVDYDKYNIDYIDAGIEEILNEMIGSSDKSAFYLPPTEYINVSKGTSYGVAYALNNPDPSGDNYFEFSWTVDDSIVTDCEVSVYEGQSWIERGWGSWGNIPEGRVDSMTIYFSFPEDAPSCSVKYNFVVEKNGEAYDMKQIELRIS